MGSDLRTDILLVTVTKVETGAVLDAFCGAEQVCPHSIDGRVYFDLGRVNGARVSMTQCEMGAGGLGASLQTVDKGITALSPAAVVMVGIAFGVSEKKQRIGEVLITKHLRPYELQRIGTQQDGQAKIILRDDKPHASPWLLNLLKSSEVTWNGPALWFGTVLTGEKLVDNLEFREQLYALEPEAIGGEMEGAGLYVACHDRKVDWILVKAICDFADGKKSTNKPEYQEIAARNAASFVRHALQLVSVDWDTHHRTTRSIYKGVRSAVLAVGEAGSPKQLHLEIERTDFTRLVGIQGRGRDRTTLRDGIFRRVITEYLYLPSLLRLGDKVRAAIGSSRNSRVYDFSRHHGLLFLWRDLLGDKYHFNPPYMFMSVENMKQAHQLYDSDLPFPPGSGVTKNRPQMGDRIIIRNAQLTPFVNRSPGRFFDGHCYFGMSLRQDTGADLQKLVADKVWTWEDYAVSELCLGDARFRPHEGYYIMNIVASTRSLTYDGFRLPYSKDELVKQTGAAASVLGFPALVHESIVSRLAQPLADCGAVALSEVRVTLAPIPENLSLIWSTGIPKFCFLIHDRSQVGATQEPSPTLCAAWTVAMNPSGSCRYATWSFLVGVSGYEKYLDAACTKIIEAIEERGLKAISEFDFSQNRFSSTPLFGPERALELLRHMEHNRDLATAFQDNEKLVSASAIVDRWLREKLVEAPQSREDLETLISGVALYNQKRNDIAMKKVSAYLSQYPRSPMVAYMKAVLLVVDGQFAEALEICDKGLVEDTPVAHRFREVLAAVQKERSKNG